MHSVQSRVRTPRVSRPALLRFYYFIAFGSFGLYLPFFPSWLEARGFTGPSMSLIASLLPLLGLLSPAIIGMLADRMGVRGRMVTVTAACSAMGVTLLTLAAGSLTPLPLVAAATSMAIFAAFRSPTTSLADVLALESGADYGRIRLFGSLGFLSAVTLGGYVVNVEHPYQLPAIIAATLWVVVLVSFLLPKASPLPPRPPLGDARALIGQPGYRWLLITAVFITLSMSSYDLCSSLRVRHLGASTEYVGYFWSLATISEIVVMYFAAPWVKRVGPGKILTFALLVTSARWLAFSVLTDLGSILWLQPLHAIVFGLMWLSVMSTLRREVGERGMATAQGLLTSAFAVGGAVGIWIWGPLYAAVGSVAVFRASSVVALTAALFATRLIRWGAPVEAPSA